MNAPDEGCPVTQEEYNKLSNETEPTQVLCQQNLLHYVNIRDNNAVFAKCLELRQITQKNSRGVFAATNVLLSVSFDAL